jgi:AraC-like DNA-binding protein
MYAEYKNFTPGRDFRMLSLFMLITGKIINAYPVPKTGNELFPTYQLSAVLGFLNREFGKHITSEDILKRIPMSRSTLNRNFSKAFGMTPMRYLNKLRLDHAAELLASSNLSISEIARQCGFEDSNYFTRAFRRKFGITPGQWRKKRGTEPF